MAMAQSLGLAQTVAHYELQFNVWSAGNKCAASDLVAGGQFSAYGVLYEVPGYLISRETAHVVRRRSFDEIEGKAYERRVIQVRRSDGAVLEAITYLVRNPRQNLHTSAEYVAHIIGGLREHGAAEEYIQSVKATAIANNPEIRSVVERL
jgi:cation transport regulator ChaC